VQDKDANTSNSPGHVKQPQLQQRRYVLLLLYEPFDRRVKSVCLLNVVINQEILINTHKTKQATSCRVTCNRVPFITRYYVFIHVRIDIIYTDKNTHTSKDIDSDMQTYQLHDKTSLYTTLTV